MTLKERPISAKPLKLSKHIFRGTLGVVRAPAPPGNQHVSTIPSGVFCGFFKGVILAPKFFLEENHY